MAVNARKPSTREVETEGSEKFKVTHEYIASSSLAGGSYKNPVSETQDSFHLFLKVKSDRRQGTPSLDAIVLLANAHGHVLAPMIAIVAAKTES